MAGLVHIVLFCGHLWIFDVYRTDDQQKQSRTKQIKGFYPTNSGKKYSTRYNWQQRNAMNNFFKKRILKETRIQKKGKLIGFCVSGYLTTDTIFVAHLFWTCQIIMHLHTYANLCVHMLICRSAVNSSSIRHGRIMPINFHRIDKAIKKSYNRNNYGIQTGS